MFSAPSGRASASISKFGAFRNSSMSFFPDNMKRPSAFRPLEVVSERNFLKTVLLGLSRRVLTERGISCLIQGHKVYDRRAGLRGPLCEHRFGPELRTGLN
jgi:hypothetical protein